MRKISNLAVDSELGHGVNNAQKGRYGLRLFANLGLVDPQFKAVMAKVPLHLFSIDVIYVQISHRKDTTPARITIGYATVLDVEYAVDKREVVFDLLISLNVEAGLGFQDSGLEVRHFEEAENNKREATENDE